ncbi:CBS domain-containing protein [Puia sp. P3]|uniref:CBS domain-containing protein n=1 Tax=Puia sp. P3 TaxID=3423952 RepID=UPI003D674D90
MIVASIAYFIVKGFEPYYMETKQLALSGEIFTHRREQNILSMLSLDNLTERDHEVFQPADSLKDLVRHIALVDKPVFAVVDAGHRLAGVIALNDIRGMLFEHELHDKTLLKDIMRQPSAVLRVGTPMKAVLEQFDRTRADYLPVTDEDARFAGFISKARIFERYRLQVAQARDIYDDD